MINVKFPGGIVEPDREKPITVLPLAETINPLACASPPEAPINSTLGTNNQASNTPAQNLTPVRGRHLSSDTAPLNSTLGANNQTSNTAPLNSTLGANNQVSDTAPINSLGIFKVTILGACAFTDLLYWLIVSDIFFKI